MLSMSRKTNAFDFIFNKNFINLIKKKKRSEKTLVYLHDKKKEMK